MARYEENNVEQSEDAAALRSALVALAMGSLSENQDKDKISYSNKLLDVTGSLGCWGVMQSE